MKKRPSEKKTIAALAAMLLGTGVVGAQAATVLFENFEQSNGVGTGSLDGQNGWSVDSGSGEVQTSVVQSGGQALEISSGGVSKEISTNGTVWLHFQARIAEAPQSEPEFDPVGSLVAFSVNPNRNLVVLKNGKPMELTAQMPLNTWTRFDIYCDCSAGFWNLAMNGSNVASGLPLASANPVERIAFSNASATGSFVDSIDMASTEQVGEMPDTDADGIPDWWEQKHFGGATACVAEAVSGNGNLTYRDTYIAVVDPFAYDPLWVAMEEVGEFRWVPKTGRLHDVEWASCLQSNFVAIASDIPWPTDTFIDTVHTNEPAGFYRVKIHL